MFFFYNLVGCSLQSGALNSPEITVFLFDRDFTQTKDHTFIKTSVEKMYLKASRTQEDYRIWYCFQDSYCILKCVFQHKTSDFLSLKSGASREQQLSWMFFFLFFLGASGCLYSCMFLCAHTWLPTVCVCLFLFSGMLLFCDQKERYKKEEGGRRVELVFSTERPLVNQRQFGTDAP